MPKRKAFFTIKKNSFVASITLPCGRQLGGPSELVKRKVRLHKRVCKECCDREISFMNMNAAKDLNGKFYEVSGKNKLSNLSETEAFKQRKEDLDVKKLMYLS